MVKRTTIIETTTVLNIILFLYTGIAKIQDYSVFKEQLADNPALAPASKAIAILLPIVEFLIVLMLMIPRWRLKGLYATLALMIAFIVYIIALFTFDKELPCSCGGIISELSWSQHLLFNGAFLLLDIWAILLLRKEKREISKEFNSASEYKTLGV